jgi:hypothetical protein
MNRNQLIKELKLIDKQIKEYKLSDEERRKERVKVLNDYNEVKDGALKAVGLIAECEGKALNKVLSERGFDFEKVENN